MGRTARIAVIGGGIGGCTAAHALHRRGFEVHVYEAQPELKEIGAGVALGPNAMKALRVLGLEQAVRDVAYQGDYQYLLSWRSGRVISKNARADAEKLYGAAGCTVHRADLLDVLSAGLPSEVLSLGARGVEVDTHGNVAWAKFKDGTEIEADAIVGADGIHSAVRASLFGPDAPRFTGKIWYKWALYDRDPMPQWTRGRATLLGDAAHPMLPYLGQGACQAMEDGCVLALALETMPDDVPGALQLYERSRRPRASQVVLEARARGVDNHLVSPLAALKRDALIWLRQRVGSDQGGRGLTWIPAYDPGSPSVLAL